MRDTYVTDGHATDHPAADIETVVVDPEDVIEALRRNQEAEDPLCRHVLRLTPPFEEEIRAEAYVQEGPERYRPDREPEPLHLDPATFVRNEDGDHPNETHITVPARARAREAAREDHGDDVDETTVDEYHGRALEEWEKLVRDSFVTTIRIHFEPATGDEIWTSARYEATDG
jgi:hypothetical protein